MKSQEILRSAYGADGLLQAFPLHIKFYKIHYAYQFNKKESDHPAQNSNKWKSRKAIT